MGRGLSILLIIMALLAGGVTGAYAGYRYYPTKNKTTEKADTTATTATSTSTTDDSTNTELETCLKAKWGADKYTAITANPSLATVDDKFNALPCYK